MRVWCLLVLVAVVGGHQLQESTELDVSSRAPPGPSITEVTPADTGPSITEVTPADTGPSRTQTAASHDPVISTSSEDKSAAIPDKQVIPDQKDSALEDTKGKDDHTITANDFAKIAAAAIAEKKQDEHIVTRPPISEGSLKDPSANIEISEKPLSDSQLKPQDVIQPAVEEPGKPSTDSSQDTTGKLKIDDDSAKGESIIESSNDGKDKSKSNNNDATVGPSSQTEPLTSSEDLLSMKELADKLSDEVKIYSNTAMLEWEPRKEKISWISEASNVLIDYIEKIQLTESAHFKDCVKEDLQKYEQRKKNLADVIKQCESSLKREDFNQMQITTKETLQKIDDIVNEAQIPIDKLSKTDPSYVSDKSRLENDAKTKLRNLDIESIKTKLKTLKDTSLRTDEVEYKKCLDERSEKSMIEDTRVAIMRIKTMCLG